VSGSVGDDLLAGIGRTPLVELEGFAPRGRRIFAKVEREPGRLDQDRPVARMIRTAIAEQRFEAPPPPRSSGNAGSRTRCSAPRSACP
jgi:hypothetical protein